jgi:hypothetical protein
VSDLADRLLGKKRLVFADRLFGGCRGYRRDMTGQFLCCIDFPDVSMGTTSANEIWYFQYILESPHFILNEFSSPPPPQSSTLKQYTNGSHNIESAEIVREELNSELQKSVISR